MIRTKSANDLQNKRSERDREGEHRTRAASPEPRKKQQRAKNLNSSAGTPNTSPAPHVPKSPRYHITSSKKKTEPPLNSPKSTNSSISHSNSSLNNESHGDQQDNEENPETSATLPFKRSFMYSKMWKNWDKFNEVHLEDILNNLQDYCNQLQLKRGTTLGEESDSQLLQDGWQMARGVAGFGWNVFRYLFAESRQEEAMIGEELYGGIEKIRHFLKRILDELMLLLGGEPGCKELAGLCLEMLMKIQPHFVVSEVNHLEDSYKMVHSLVNNTFVYLVDLRDLTSLLLSYLYSMSVNGPLSQASPLKLFSVVDSISTNLVEIVHEIASARQATSYLDVQREMDFDAFRCNLQNQVDKLKTEIRMADKLFPPFSLGTPPQIFKSIIEDTGDFTITRVIIANYSSFTTFEELMASFIVGLTPPEGASMDEQDYSELKERIRKHLKYWCYFHYDDFTLQPHYLHLLEVDCLPKIGEQDPKKFINRLHKRNKSVDSAMLPDFTLQTLLDISPVISATPQQIATQISIISATLFLKISPTEFLGQSWTKLSHRHKSPNIIQFLKRTDYLSFWVATTILISGGIEKRCEAIKWFIKIAECLHGLMDFNSLMAIIVGLNNSSISRLKKSWKLVPEEELMTFHNLTKLMSPELSFKAYRACLCSVTIPCVPFLAVYLSDLTFIHEGNPDQINGQINIAKIEMIYDIINKLQQHQLLLKVGKKVEPFATYLAVLPRLNDRVLYKLSLLLEPREVPPLTPSSKTKVSLFSGMDKVNLKASKDKIFQYKTTVLKNMKSPRGESKERNREVPELDWKSDDEQDTKDPASPEIWERQSKKAFVALTSRPPKHHGAKGKKLYMDSFEGEREMAKSLSEIPLLEDRPNSPRKSFPDFPMADPVAPSKSHKKKPYESPSDTEIETKKTRTRRNSPERKELEETNPLTVESPRKPKKKIRSFKLDSPKPAKSQLEPEPKKSYRRVSNVGPLPVSKQSDWTRDNSFELLRSDDALFWCFSQFLCEKKSNLVKSDRRTSSKLPPVGTEALECYLIMRDFEELDPTNTKEINTMAIDLYEQWIDGAEPICDDDYYLKLSCSIYELATKGDLPNTFYSDFCKILGDELKKVFLEFQKDLNRLETVKEK